ncbi:hypothetical protein HETIRDRAFT_450386 [Heterobasidion irregulare TC 32-1]|uniref:Uncharacterized protein n=1 Tax=Heterobasidion irregulare (strain TC 32-1) TaxID=747525 RepID=W4K9N4_HETIT|nr:uncharacterized protein HETIRDRAFT_450386 [Heterobasidion irregulare TC 32-1]ETW82552.1 hypothetical protein HETIRDRAFT_450386 [Heterobasidion irregulare TC 32-1]
MVIRNRDQRRPTHKRAQTLLIRDRRTRSADAPRQGQGMGPPLARPREANQLVWLPVATGTVECAVVRSTLDARGHRADNEETHAKRLWRRPPPPHSPGSHAPRAARATDGNEQCKGARGLPRVHHLGVAKSGGAERASAEGAASAVNTEDTPARAPPSPAAAALYDNFTARSTHIDIPLARPAASPEPPIFALRGANQGANQAAARVVMQIGVVAARGSGTGARACEHVTRLDVRFAARSGGGGRRAAGVVRPRVKGSRESLDDACWQADLRPRPRVKGVRESLDNACWQADLLPRPRVKGARESLDDACWQADLRPRPRVKGARESLDDACWQADLKRCHLYISESASPPSPESAGTPGLPRSRCASTPKFRRARARVPECYPFILKHNIRTHVRPYTQACTQQQHFHTYHSSTQHGDRRSPRLDASTPRRLDKTLNAVRHERRAGQGPPNDDSTTPHHPTSIHPKR